MVQWLRLHAPNVGGMGSIPSQKKEKEGQARQPRDIQYISVPHLSGYDLRTDP